MKEKKDRPKNTDNSDNNVNNNVNHHNNNNGSCTNSNKVVDDGIRRSIQVVEPERAVRICC